MRRRKWTSNGQFRHQNDSGYDNSFPTRHFPSKIEKWNIMLQRKTAKWGRGRWIPPGWRRSRGSSTWGRPSWPCWCQGPPQRWASSQILLKASLLLSLTVNSPHSRSCSSAGLQAWNIFFDEKRMLEMLEEIGSVETETNRPRIFGARKRQLE